MDECVPLWMVGIVVGPLVTVIGILWKRIGEQDERTEAMLDDFVRHAISLQNRTQDGE